MSDDLPPITRTVARSLLAELARGADGRDETERALRLLERVAALDADEAGAVRALLLEAGAVAAVQATRCA